MTVEERVLRLENAFVQMTAMAQNLDERDETHAEWINTLGARMDELAEAQKQTQADISALTVIVGDVDKSLKSLAETVERFINEGRNGKP